MSKPLSMMIRETKEKIVTVMNESCLSIDILDMILGEIRTIVHVQAEQEYAKQLEAYRKEVEDGKSE